MPPLYIASSQADNNQSSFKLTRTQPTTGNYRNVVLKYTPKLNEERDQGLIEILPESQERIHLHGRKPSAFTGTSRRERGEVGDYEQVD